MFTGSHTDSTDVNKTGVYRSHMCNRKSLCQLKNRLSITIRKFKVIYQESRGIYFQRTNDFAVKN